jgi:Rrf2 family protein
MKLSTKGRYGIRVMIELALRYGDGPIMMDTISNCVSVSRKYLYTLLTSLKTAGLVHAVRGAAGGFQLTRPPADISACDVVQSLEGSLSLVDCIDGGRKCERAGTCAARDLWHDTGDAIRNVLSGVSLLKLANKQKAKRISPPMYHI